MNRIYDVAIEAYDPALPGVVTLRYATESYVTGADDTPAHTWVDGRIQQPANFQRSCFDGGKTFGASRVGAGELILVNADGALDALIDFGFDGRAITLRRGEVGPGSAGVPSWTTILRGTMQSAEIGWRLVSLRLRDRQAELDRPLQGNRYAGSNVLPAGVEGVAEDLAGKPKPWGWGRVFNISPPCVNTSRLIYQVHDGAVASIDAVYDRAAPLTAGAAYANQADMEANAPAAGYFQVWAAGGMFRLGGAPAGQVTADATIGANAAARTAAQTWATILAKAGLSAGDWDAGDVTALDAATAAEVGVWYGEEVRTLAALDEVANAVGAWWGPDRFGVFRLARIEAPAGTPVATLTTLEVRRLDRHAAGSGVPAWRLGLGYRKFWATQDSDLAGSVGAARRGELRAAFRKVSAEDATVRTKHLLAAEQEFETVLVETADAQDEVDRRLGLYGVRRDLFEARVTLDADLAAVLDLGVVVRLQVPRFGLADGKLLLVVGVRPDLRAEILDLTLWG